MVQDLKLPLAALPTHAALELVRDVVRSELSAVPQSPILYDRTGLARVLSCSASMVDNLRKQGMPAIYIGDSPRFELPRVMDWLKDNGEKA